jgi:predicted nucleic acid-binding protein
VILVDTSAWVEYLRAAGSHAHIRLRTALDRGEGLASTDPVVMEILAGARDDSHRDALKRLLYRCTMLAVEGPADYEEAAELYRACRSHGESPRKLTDCLIAAVAIRNDTPLLHSDSDFLAIARHTRLRPLPPST